MCLIIYKPNGVNVPEELLRSAITHNNDGFGLMFPENGKVVVYKDHRSEYVYEPYFRHAEKEMLIHLRMQTHGKINLDNTHPFHIGGETWFMHNGVLLIDTKKKPDMSDTWHFNEKVLKWLYKFDPSDL